MSSKRDDGGDAFPRATHGGMNGDPGMSLRDYFAAQALIGMGFSKMYQNANKRLAGDDLPATRIENGTRGQQIVARMCYQMADAMLKARSEPAK